MQIFFSSPRIPGRRIIFNEAKAALTALGAVRTASSVVLTP
ncbi:MAG: hypothetical protein QM714_13765 [Nocardioides sp.]